MSTKKELALTHIYPKLAGITEKDRRQVLLNVAHVYSSLELTKDSFKLVMAAFEAILWEKVKAGTCPDPRLCTKCGRPLKPRPRRMGECPEGCETRKQYAAATHYWRSRVPKKNAANERVVWKIKQLWDLLVDYLPEENQNDSYLAGVIYKTGKSSEDVFPLENQKIQWDQITPECGHATIEALKFRLKCAVS